MSEAAGRAYEPHAAERWILSRTDAVTAEATRLLEGYLFGEYTALLQQFLWGEVADAYVELAKAGLKDESRADGVVRTLAYVLDRSLRLLHPIMPFITDTLALQLWHGRTRVDAAPSLVIAMWPEAGRRDEALEERFGLVLDVVRAIRNLRQEAGVEPSDTVDVAIGGDTASISWAAPHIAALTNAEVRFGAGEGSATVVRTVEVRLAVRRDAGEERWRLTREFTEAKLALEKSRALVADPKFVERAPQNVMEKERARLAEREERVRLIEAQIAAMDLSR